MQMPHSLFSAKGDDSCPKNVEPRAKSTRTLFSEEVETMEVVVPGDGKPKPQQTSVGTGSSTVMDCCPDRAAAISMLPLADDRISCDSCDKDIKYVSWTTRDGAGKGVRGRARTVGVAAKRRGSSAFGPQLPNFG